MIKPTEITDFNRTEKQLQEFLLFCIVVAGKNSHQQAVKLDKFLSLWPHLTPFETINKLDSFGMLRSRLEYVRMGQYNRITKAFLEVAKLPPLTGIPISELENVKGIGMKTSRFFLLHSRPNQQVAVLDTHILKWMREQGYAAPKATPTGFRYEMLEHNFLGEARKRGMKPADLDLAIWKEKSQKSLTP